MESTDMNRVRSIGPSMLLTFSLAAMLLGGPYLMRNLAWAQQDARVDHARTQLRDSPLAQLSQAFREVARAVEPSVVHIQVSRKINQPGARGGENLSPEDMLRRFFRDRYGMEPDQPARPGQPRVPEEEDGEDYDKYNPMQPSGSGSGWIYEHADGKKYIVTNNHVVKDSDEVLVKFFDKTERIATVVGTDAQTDIAVLKVENGSLHGARLAAEPVEQGDMVFAFGSPFQFEFSMSQGIVSGTSRRLGILGQMGYEDFIQTDAAINPGNSGGPLTNIHGEVIGMNTAIATRTGAFSGIGFAIPTGMIKSVVAQLIESGKVTRGYLGVWIKDLDEKLARSFGYDGQGVLVEDAVNKQSPAAKAGLEGGDIITHLNDQPVRSASAVALMPPGAKVALKVFRDGKVRDVTVTLGTQPTDGLAGQPDEPGAEEGDIENGQLEPLRRLGLADVATLTPELAQQAQIDFVPGVIIRDVRPASAAALQGLRPGTVILEVDGKSVDSAEDLAKAIAGKNLADGVRMRVMVEGVRRFVFLEIPG
jgi:serine protease Do